MITTTAGSRSALKLTFPYTYKVTANGTAVSHGITLGQSLTVTPLLNADATVVSGSANVEDSEPNEASPSAAPWSYSVIGQFSVPSGQVRFLPSATEAASARTREPVLLVFLEGDVLPPMPH